MKLYSSSHLSRINLYGYAIKNLQRIPHEKSFSNADEYFRPTIEFDKMVEKHNLFAILKGIKPAKHIYKHVYLDDRTNKFVWQ